MASLTNTGSIVGSGMGVVVSSGASLTGLSNLGYISGLNNAGVVSSMVNSGSVASLANSGVLTSLVNNSVAGTISNTGTLSSLVNAGSVAGVNNSGNLVSLSNSGTVNVVNNTGTLSSLVNAGAITNGVTNAGLIGGAAVAITASGSAFTLSNQSAGTVVGAINGTVNVSNSGLIALQSAYNGTTYAGSPVAATITGNYVQASSGTLQLGLTNSGSLVYSQLSVSGTASFAANSNLSIVMSSANAIVGGQTLNGIISAGTLVTNGLTIVDNSALVGFRYVTVGGTLSLVSFNTPNCGSVVGGFQPGACEVGVGIPSLTVTGLGTIAGGTQGINVLAANLTGRIINQGTVQGTSTGIRFVAGGTLSAGITNSGLIQGLGYSGVIVNGASVGGIANNGGTIVAAGRGINVIGGAVISGGISNSGLIANNNSTIAGAAAVVFDASTLTGGFFNTGNITSSGTALLLSNNAQLLGGINNLAGGTISAAGIAISLTLNSAISAISNAGLISSNGVNGGVVLSGSTIIGGIANTGSIVSQGNYAIYVNNQSSVIGTLSNSGYVRGLSNAGYLGGLTNNAGVIANGINNTGTIGSPVFMYQGMLTGGLTNTGLMQGVIAYGSSLVGDVANQGGTIASTAAAISIQMGSTVTGTLTNTGMITGLRGVTLTAAVISGGITSGGSIVGTSGAGIEVASNTTLSGLNNTGYISSVSNAGTITAISNLGGTIANGVTNAGLIGGIASAITAGGTTLTLLNLAAGTVVGALNGTLNVSNSGLIALQTMSSGVIVAGSHVNASISGNYVQNSGGTLQIGINGSSGSGATSGNYSVLNVAGAANFGGGFIYASMSQSDAVLIGQTVSGVVNAGSPVSVTSLTLRDNSSTIDYQWVTNAGTLSLVAIQQVAPLCNATVTGSQQGPCQVGANGLTNLLVGVAGSIGGGTLGIQVMSTTAGSIVNQGTVLGSQTGIWMTPGATLTGGLSNTGLIQGVLGGVVLAGSSGVVSSLQGGLNNASTGTIAGANVGVSIMSGSTLSGGLTNAGLITGTAGAGVNLSASGLLGSVNNLSNATISGAQNGLIAIASTITAGINNAGLISGSSLAGASLSNAQIIAGGINNVGGTMSGVNQAGLLLAGTTVAGGLSNTGLITGVSSSGLSMSTSLLLGNLTNQGGTISGLVNGMSIAGASIAGFLNNFGLITGASGTGVSVATTTLVGGVANFATGTMTGQQGLLMTGSVLTGGGVTNSGLITGSSLAGVALTNVQMPTGGVVNLGGTMSGVNQAGLLIQASTLGGNITNTGLITGTSSTGVQLVGSTVTGFLSNANAGTVSGAQGGLSLSGSLMTAGLTNAGLITGTGVSSTGIALAAGSTINGGVVNLANATISGGQTGLSVSVNSLVNGSLTNAGLITGGTYAINAPSLTSIVSTGTTSQFVGMVNAGSAALSVANGSTLTAGSAMTLSSVNVANGGQINLAANGSTVSGGVTVSNGFTNAGVVNVGQSAATITGSYAQALLGNLFVPVNGSNGSGTASGAYGQLHVTGTANFASNTNITVSMNAQNSVLAGGTLAGVVTAGNLITNGFTIVDNSALVNFVWSTVGGTLSLVAVANANVCGATISGAQAGPCQVAYNNPNLFVSGLGSITGGAQGVQVLSGLITGQIANQGLISGTQTGVQFGAGATLTGGLTNSGVITGQGAAGVAMLGSLLQGGLNNIGGSITGGNTGLSIAASSIAGGISNTGYIQGLTGSGVALVNSQVSGNLHNAGGTIAGVQNGLSMVGSVISSGITNAGLITGIGVSSTGIAIAGASIINGGLNNTANATISGGQTGLSISASSQLNGGLTNAGLITGGTYAINAPSLTSIVSTGTTSQFVGMVNAGSAALSVANGSTLTAGSAMTLSSVNVANGGQINLAANGSTVSGGVTVSNGFTNAGVVNVGQSAATITGNYSQLSTGSLAYAPGGRLFVNGSANLGANTNIQAPTIQFNVNSFVNGNSTTIITVAGSLVSNGFNVTGGTPVIGYRAVVGTNSVNLVAQPNNLQTIIATQNNVAGQGAAGALNSVLSGFVNGATSAMTPVAVQFANMSSNAQVSQAVSQSLPVLSSESPVQTLAVLTAINQSIEARSLKLRGISSGHEMYGNNNVWMKPFGSWMNQGNMDGAYGFKANAGGLMLGADHQWDDKVRFGGAFAWGNSSANSNMGGQSQTSNMYQFIGYGAYALTPSVNVNFQANGGWNNNTTSRNISFLGTNAQGSYDSAVWHAGVGIDRPTKLSEDTTFIPQARFDYTWIRNQGYSETGAAYGMGLNVGSQTYQTSVLGVDAKVEHKLTDHNSVSANLGVGYNFSPTQTWVAASYQGASALQFTTTGVNPSATMGRAGVGYTYKIKEGVDVGIRYDIDVQEKYTNQIGTAKARWSF